MEYNISIWIILNWTCANKYNYQYNSQCLQKLETNKIESWQIWAFKIDFISNIVIHTPVAVENIHAGMDANHFVTLIVSILYILVVFINISLFYNVQISTFSLIIESLQVQYDKVIHLKSLIWLCVHPVRQLLQSL